MGTSYTATYVWTGAGDGTSWADTNNWTYYDSNGNPTTYPLTWVNGQQVAVPPGTSSTWAPVAFSSNATVDLGGQTYAGVSNMTVDSGAAVTLENGTLSANGLTVADTGTLALSGTNTTLNAPSSAAIDGTLGIAGGATVSLNGSVAGTVVFGDAPEGTHNTLVLNNPSLTVGSVQNFTPADSVVVEKSGYPHVRWIQEGSSNTYTLVAFDGNWTQNAIVSSVSFAPKLNADGTTATDANGNTVYYSPLDLSPATTSAGTIDGNHGDAQHKGSTYYQNAGLTYDSSAQTATVTCFLAGSLIRTAKGDVAVEDVRVGDLVLTVTTGQDVYQPVIWAGYQTATARADLPDDEAGYPVRIRAGAIADGVPYEDLLITPEHCLFLNGRFVPVRMLVNGSSIFYDRSLTQYTYYHVETAQHAVIMANGMLTESYLDTGNRGRFTQAGKVATLGAGPRNWAQHAAVPLAVTREEVEPLFRALATRAAQADAGCEGAMLSAPELTHDADLHLETVCGKTIRKIRERDGMTSFMLPSGVTQVRLVSRASRPCDVEGPFVDDRRMLGVLVGDILIQEGNLAPCSISPPKQTSALPGWHAPEPNGARWTDGYALLEVPTTLPHALRVLTVNILSAGPYVREDTPLCRCCVNH
ncbi:Hint domain-containing protein [Acetobacter cerevisiae]|uniref:Hint domain-containing protein n=1 Tax=Acetobacter cerevisiae TaxID=178900 RepID=UPI00209E29A2|nr:Hint domain-containing protein [Acetobacter cerevisiae]MCP1270605.1 Hint domain-containing protein [Acetobacter cerevisiae]MCP1278559.1 Hint domain-containing protein [Acetobacter cerevisiae]